MAAAPAVELELDFLVWKDKNGVEQTTPAHTIPSGTRFIANQSTAPVGWTKESVHNDKALRVTSGAAGSGGNSAFNTVFGKTATDSHTLTAAQMPSHTHSTSSAGSHSHTARGTRWNFNGAFAPAHLRYNSAFSPGNDQISSNSTINGMHNAGAHTHNTNSAGSGKGHSHGMDIRVKYVDVIIVIKD